MSESIVSEDEMIVLAEALAAARGGVAAPAPLWEQLVTWAMNVRTDSALLELVLRGKLAVDRSLEDDDWSFTMRGD